MWWIRPGCGSLPPSVKKNYINNILRRTAAGRLQLIKLRLIISGAAALIINAQYFIETNRKGTETGK